MLFSDLTGFFIAQIEISLEDENGNLCLAADNLLSVHVSGAGHLLALENGCSTDHTPGREPSRKAHYGLLLAVIQSNREEPGSIRVEVSGEGLQTASLELSSAKAAPQRTAP